MPPELYRTRKVQQLAAVLRERCAELGHQIPGDDAARLVAGRVEQAASMLGITTRTVLASYITEESMLKLAETISHQMGELADILTEAPGVDVSYQDGFLVLAAFGMCSVVAQRNIDDQHAAIVLRDAADSTVHTAVTLGTADTEPVTIEGMTLAIGRKVITAVLEYLATGAWQCTCGTTHRSDGGCPLQDRLTLDLATLGGWAPNADARS